jgi:hypothetical protein
MVFSYPAAKNEINYSLETNAGFYVKINIKYGFNLVLIYFIFLLK